MTKLKPNDKVDCRIKSSIIVSPYKSYDEIKTFQIIGVDAHGYYLYVPEYYCLKDTLILDKYYCKQLKIDVKYAGERYIYINSNLVAGINSVFDGLMCIRCKEYFLMAEPNQPDGTLICYCCRLNPYR